MFGFITKVFNYFDRHIDKAYVSDADRFLQAYDHSHPTHTESQRKEVEKHRNLFYRNNDSRVRW